MALIYVAKSGNDTSGTGASGNPYLTIARGIRASKSGDEVVVRAGIYLNEGGTNGLAPVSGTTIRAEVYPKLLGPVGDPRGLWDAAHSVIIDQGGGSTTRRGFYCAGKSNVTIIGFEIRNAFNGVEFGGSNDNNNWNTVRACYIHDCSDNGISTTSAMQLTIDGNEVHDCCPNASGRSNISVLRNRISPATLAGGYHVRITNNCSHHSMRPGGNSSDANGIIVDKMHHYGDMYADMRVLVQGNYCWGNRGPGIKVMASRQIDVLDNTTYNNFRIKKPPYNGTGTTWGGDIVSQNSNKNTWRRNIGVATGIYGSISKSGGFANVGQATGYEETWPLTGNTIVDNLFFGYDKDGAGGERPATDVHSNRAEDQLPSATTNKLGTALGLTSAADIFVAPDANPPDFRVKSSSPAYNGVGGTQHIGAWKGTTPPPTTVLTVVTAPAMEILGTPIDASGPVYPSGATVRFQAATYNAELTAPRTFTVQWYNGTAYETKAATITGPTSGGWYSFVAPTVTKRGGLRVKETATDGTTTLNPTSNWIDIAPAPVVVVTPPANTALPSISPSAPKVGSAATCSTGTWSGTTPMTFAFQWQAAGVDIPGATGQSYTPVADDKTKALTCKVTAANSAGSATATSAATSAVTDPTDLTLEQVTAQLLAAQADILALRADLNAQTTRNNTQDGDIAAVESRFGSRIGDIEEYIGGLRERLEIVESALEGGTDDDDLSAVVYEMQDQVANLLRIVGAFSTTGRLSLRPRAEP